MIIEPYIQYLNELQESYRYRFLPSDQSIAPCKLDFSTNDYLNLSHHPEVLNAALAAGQQYGVGATGSRLLSGNREIFELLEAAIAVEKKTETALIFNSGFQANAATLSTLLNQKVLSKRALIFFDKLNHASLYQGVALSGAELIRYRHLDLNHLSDCLKKVQNVNRPKWIVTETLFGMDGDIAPLKDILLLAKMHGAGVYLDEAHAIGVLGNNGYGLSTLVEFEEVPHIIMGTLSKAVGCSGGYVACSQVIKSYLINQSPGFIYTTGLSPMIVGAALKAWQKIKEFNVERKKLMTLSQFCKNQLVEKGFSVTNTGSQIVPVLIRKEQKALTIHQDLMSQGIMTSIVRPPTVPPNTARLRLSFNLQHQAPDIEKLLEALCKYS